MGASSCGLLPRWCARHRFLAAPEDLDDAHGAAAAGAWLAQGERAISAAARHGGLFRALVQSKARIFAMLALRAALASRP
jgi:hypothetical protein